MKLKEQIIALSHSCFEIEDQLPVSNIWRSNSPGQDLRNELFKLRCDIIALQHHAEMIDNQPSKEL